MSRGTPGESDAAAKRRIGILRWLVLVVVVLRVGIGIGIDVHA